MKKNSFLHSFEELSIMQLKWKWSVMACFYRSAVFYTVTYFSHLLLEGHPSKSTEIYIIVFNSCIIIDSGHVSHLIQLFLSFLDEPSVSFQFFDSPNKAEINFLYFYLCALVFLFPKD